MPQDRDALFVLSGQDERLAELLEHSRIVAVTARGLTERGDRAFGVAQDSNEIAQVITVFFFGLAFAQLIWGPLSDRFGRKPILAAGLVIYVAGAVMSAMAPSLKWLLVARFI